LLLYRVISTGAAFLTATELLSQNVNTQELKCV